jgi:hypothetical protein
MNYTKPLLSDNNAKTRKGEKLGYKTFIMYMSPFTQNSKGINLCSHASEGCAAACLFGSGFGGMFTNVEQGRINKTEFYLNDRIGFLDKLVKEITKLEKKYKDSKETLCIRLNGTSDISFEKQLASTGKTIFDTFPDVQFYDYTKNWTRFNKPLPENYHLTFSRSETNHNKAMELLSKGINVAMVFSEIPTSFRDFKVVNGDENDLTFLQPKGVIVGLKYKKLTKKGADNDSAFTSGFAIKITELV